MTRIYIMCAWKRYFWTREGSIGLYVTADVTLSPKFNAGVFIKIICTGGGGERDNFIKYVFRSLLSRATFRNNAGDDFSNFRSRRIFCIAVFPFSRHIEILSRILSNLRFFYLVLMRFSCSTN